MTPPSRPVLSAPAPRRPPAAPRRPVRPIGLNLRTLRRLTLGMLALVLAAWGVPRARTQLDQRLATRQTAEAGQGAVPLAVASAGEPKALPEATAEVSVIAPSRLPDPSSNLQEAFGEGTPEKAQEDEARVAVAAAEAGQESNEEAVAEAVAATPVAAKELPAGTPLWVQRPIAVGSLAAVPPHELNNPPLANWDGLRRAVDVLPIDADPTRLTQDQRLALLRWDLASRCGADSLSSVALSDSGRAFLGRLGRNDAWMRELLDLCEWHGDAAQVLPLLAVLVKADPSVESDPVLRPMASALALAGAGREWTPDYLVQRQAYYADRHRSGRLNRRFEQLQPWERYWVAYGVQHDRFNSIKGMEYLNDRAALPVKDYIGACWRPEYRRENWYGDSVHESSYYAVFEPYFANSVEMVEDIGGVCGSLSNFGAAAAVANGVPAMIMGEPGHCAFAVMVEPGRMEPGYSLSWQRGMHAPVFGLGWSDQRAYEIAHRDPLKIAQAREAERLARALACRGLDEPNAEGVKWDGAGAAQAERLWRASIALAPTDQLLWRSYAEFGARSDADLKWWQTFHAAAAATFGPKLGGVAWRWCGQAEEKLVALGAKPEQLAATMLALHRALGADWGESRWKLAEAITTQIGRLEEKSAREAFLAEVLRCHLNHPAVLGDVILAGVETFGSEPEQQRRFYEFIANAAQSMGGDGGKQVLTNLANSVLPKAEEAGDRETFQRIGQLVGAAHPALEVAFEPFDGDLLSSGGLLQVSGAGGQHDSVDRHWGVLELHGGRFHTAGGDTNQATVELGSYGELSGIVLVQLDNNHSRIEGCQVEVSMDGKDWTRVATVTGQDEVIRLDLGSTRPQARFVRLSNRPDQHLHLHQILVYGRKLN